ncbi:hypothetical protein [Streptomyces californicus]|uniref:hypothetical protein n=1 Tax=Streptomyces californicus TaxID=67351 RepID=UPI0036CAD15C
MATVFALLPDLRESAVRRPRAARAFAFDDGRLTENGTHQELMNLGGEYAAVFMLQTDGHRAEAGETA